jgi:ABC-type transporter Mla subunit MlaD
MARVAHWKDLKIGIIAAGAVLAASLAVLMFARVGALRGETFRLFVRAGAARGLMRGSEVWVAGERVGRVSDIQFLPPAAGADPLLIVIDVLERHRQAIRRDSRAQIQNGGKIIGAPIVSITVGTRGAQMVASGDTIHSRAQADLEGIRARFADAGQQFPAVIADVKRLNQQLRSSRGTIGAFGSEGGAVELKAVRARSGRIVNSLSEGRGTLGRLLAARDPLQARAQAALARADSLRQFVASSSVALGRFKRDTTLRATVADVQNELSIVRALLEGARGTAGRLERDRAIVEELTETERQIGAIMEDIRRRPFRYLSF